MHLDVGSDCAIIKRESRTVIYSSKSRPAGHHLVAPDDDFPTCDRVSVTLVIYSASLNSDEITRRLAIASTDTDHDSLRSPGRNKRNRKGQFVWVYETEKFIQSREVRTHLDHLITILLPIKADFEALQDLPGVQMTVWIYWWGASGGPVLWPQHMFGLSELNLELQIDVTD